MQQLVAAFIERHTLLNPGQRVLVGVSGGLDSTVLAYLLRDLGYQIELAHVNYRRRGEASDNDAAFVADLSEQWAVPVHKCMVKPESLTEYPNTSFQDAARQLRYQFFEVTAQSHGLESVAVAHHLNDQAETILLALLRGRGPEGLAGMYPKRPLVSGLPIDLIRPLLSVPRDMLKEWALHHDIPWQHDASNESLDYRRNALRHQVMPLLEMIGETAAASNMARSATLLQKYVTTQWTPALDLFWAVVATSVYGYPALQVSELVRLGDVWKGRLVIEAVTRWFSSRPSSHRYVSAILELLESEVGRHVHIGAGTVWRERNTLVFVSPSPSEEPKTRSLQPGMIEPVQGGFLHFDQLAVPPAQRDPRTRHVAYFDADVLGENVRLRPWHEGDRMQPLGMTGTKRISDILTEAKVPVFLRPGFLVLERNGRIGWVVGIRQGAFAAVKADTKRIAKFTLLSDRTAER